MNVRPSRIAVHVALILYTVLALGPIVLILINAFKTRRAIFADPLGLPNGQTFTTIGFDQCLRQCGFRALLLQQPHGDIGLARCSSS